MAWEQKRKINENEERRIFSFHVCFEGCHYYFLCMDINTSFMVR